MACTYGYLGALSLVLSTACSDDNPLFHLGTIGGDTTEAGETTNGQGTTTTPTPTSGDETTGRTTTGPSGSSSAGMTDDTSATDITDGTTEGPATTTLTTDPNTTTGQVDSSSGSTGGDAGCGNEKVEVGEECDHGGDNGMGGECTSECKFDICGDEYVGPGEECDNGQANANDASCTKECQKAFCGDGHTYVGVETCDESGNNGQKANGCSNDCMVMIPQKTLRIGVTPSYPGKLYDLVNSGIKGADGLCNKHFPGFKAMIAGPGRVASLGDYDGEGQSADWPVKKYRAYTRMDNMTIVFVTGSEGLPGVSEGKPISLVNSIGSGDMWTGLTKTWKSATDNCNGWSKPEDFVSGQLGDASKTDSEFISAKMKECSSFAGIYCVEQPG